MSIFDRGVEKYLEVVFTEVINGEVFRVLFFALKVR